MPRRLILFNLLVGVVGLVLVAALVRELVTSRPLPPPPAARAPQPAPPAGPAPAVSPVADLSAYSVISARNLFNPARSESSVVASKGLTVKPLLHGVVLDGPRSRAYLEDPAAKRVFSYTVGDTVGPGRIATIGADRVMITGPEGSFEVLLRDPSKPRPSAPGTPAAPAVTPAPAMTQAPVAPATAAAPVTPGPPVAPALTRTPRLIPGAGLQQQAGPRQPRNLPGSQRPRGQSEADPD